MMFFFWNKNYIPNFKRNFIISPSQIFQQLWLSHKLHLDDVVFVHLSACVDKTYLHILILKDESRLASFFYWNFYSITYTCMPSACVCHNCLLLNDTKLSSALGLKHQSVALSQTNKPRTKIPKSFFIFSFYFFLLFFPSNLGSSLLCGL